MSDRGFIALARGILDHPIVGASKPYRESEAWLWMLFEAAWKPRRVRATNGRAVIALPIDRGQLSYSRSYIASAWGWSEKRVRTFFDRLETDRMIGRQTGQLQTVITICNYEAYQKPLKDRGQQTGPQTGRQWAGNGPETEQGNNSKKDITRSRAGEPEGFSEWYEAYPRKQARKAASKAFSKVIKSGEINLTELMARTAAFAEAQLAKPKADHQFIPYPASWLNSGQYLDDVTPSSSPTPPEGVQIAAPRDPKTYTESDWRKRLAALANDDQWLSLWGPRPGAPGCLVPASLLVGVIPTEKRISA